ncbi:sensor histidine kinase [Deferrisoma sp.]
MEFTEASETVERLSRRLAEASTLEEGVEALAWALAERLLFYRLSLVLPLRDPDRYWVAASWAERPEEEMAGYTFGLAGHPLAPVVTDGRPVVRHDPENDAPELPVSRLFRGEGKRWELGVPLALAARRGMLVLASRHPEPPGPEQVAWAEGVARWASVWARPWCGPGAPEMLRELYQSLLEGALDGIALLRDGEIVYANPSFRELFGLSPAAAEGLRLVELLEPGSRKAMLKALDELAERPRVLPRVEVEARGPQGRPLVLDLGFQAMLHEGVPAVLVQVHNATARARREQEIRERVDHLLRVLGHDLRTPLTAVLGYGQLLDERLDKETPEKLREMVAVLRRSAEGLRRLAEGMLEYAALGREGSPLGPVVLEPLLRTVEAELADPIVRSGAAIRYRGLPERVWGRPVEVGRVFRNLFENAIRYAQPGVPPEIEVAGEGEDRGFHVISVADNGRGVAPEDRERIFGLFEKGPGGGTGLGLALVHRIVTGYGGRVWVEPGEEGSRFYVTLPRAPEA